MKAPDLDRSLTVLLCSAATIINEVAYIIRFNVPSILFEFYRGEALTSFIFAIKNRVGANNQNF